MTHFAHALMVGGSGMLAECSRECLKTADLVTVMARDESRIRAIDPRLSPAVCDYTNKVALRETLAELPVPDLVIVWMHGKLPDARRALAQAVRKQGRFVQVLGSAHGDPAHPDRLENVRRVSDGLDIVSQAVVLGFAIDAGISRWLTDAEISQGVFSAVISGRPLTTIGTVSPWSARP